MVAPPTSTLREVKYTLTTKDDSAFLEAVLNFSAERVLERMNDWFISYLTIFSLPFSQKLL